MAWYRSGSISLTNGSATITGSGTAFIANASIGEGLIAPDGRTYEITNIVSDTSLTISPAYLGSTASAQAYAIAPLRGRVADLIAEASSLLASFTTVRDGIGAGLFPDGVAATPGFRFANDQDTGIFRVGANQLGVATGGVVRMVFGDAGNIGIGSAPSGSYRLLVSRSDNGNIAQFTDGVESTFVIRTESGVLQCGQANNLPLALVTNGTERFRITGAGNVGIGTTTPGAKFEVFGGDISQARLTIRNGSGRPFDLYAGIPGISESGFCIRDGTASANRLAIDASGHVLAGGDNSQTLGGASNRWSVVYAGTGTINTSDEREKHWRGELNAAELRAAKRIIAELGIYQWNDAVAEKGEDEARLHFGVRAQRAFAIMQDEGLDWGRYAWACYDQWEEQTEPVMEEVTVTKTRTVMQPSETLDEETGEPIMVEVEESYEKTEMQPTGETRVTLAAGDRYGIRPDQLAFWLIAAQAAIQVDLEARLAALEAA